MNDKHEYVVLLPLPGHPDGWYAVARAVTPDGAAEVVRVLLAQRAREHTEILVRVSVVIGEIH